MNDVYRIIFPSRLFLPNHPSFASPFPGVIPVSQSEDSAHFCFLSLYYSRMLSLRNLNGVYLKAVIQLHSLKQIPFLKNSNLVFILYWSILDFDVLLSVHSKVIQLYVYMQAFFFRFFSHIGYYKLLSRLTIYFIYSNVYMLIPTS